MDGGKTGHKSHSLAVVSLRINATAEVGLESEVKKFEFMTVRIEVTNESAGRTMYYRPCSLQALPPEHPSRGMR